MLESKCRLWSLYCDVNFKSTSGPVSQWQKVNCETFCGGQTERPTQRARAFAENISTKLQLKQRAQPNNTPLDWQSVSDVIKEEATNTLGYQSPNYFNTWFNAECVDLTERKNTARLAKENARTREQKELANERYKKGERRNACTGLRRESTKTGRCRSSNV